MAPSLWNPADAASSRGRVGGCGTVAAVSAPAPRPTAQVVMELLESMTEHSYGESLDMLSHSVQAADLAQAAGADEALVCAALLHDIGHLLGEAGAWGLPSHADVGASWLQAATPAEVHRPIALHVDAKRHLVAIDSTYAAELSEASTVTLRQQGGPFGAEESAVFLDDPFAEASIELRRWDDLAKEPGRAVTNLAEYRPLVEAFVGTGAR